MLDNDEIDYYWYYYLQYVAPNMKLCSKWMQVFWGPGVEEAILKERGCKSRTGPQSRCIKLSAKVQTAKWAKFISGSEGLWPNCFPDRTSG